MDYIIEEWPVILMIHKYLLQYLILIKCIQTSTNIKHKTKFSKTCRGRGFFGTPS